MSVNPPTERGTGHPHHHDARERVRANALSCLVCARAVPRGRACTRSCMHASMSVCARARVCVREECTNVCASVCISVDLCIRRRHFTRTLFMSVLRLNDAM
eukprot:6199831-Pleurochrysis_carterae.AAC.1